MSHHPSNEIDRYPIGRYTPPSQITAAHRTEWIECLSRLPSEVQRAVAGLSADQLASPYRVGGWTVRQVVHHLPDSHLNSYIRFRLALTEDDPAIRPYDEAAWAELTDARSAPVELSLALLEALHARWLVLLHALTDEQWARTFAILSLVR